MTPSGHLRFFCMIIAIFGVVVLRGLAAEGKTESVEELFFRANQAYKEGRFQEATDQYNQLVRSGHRSGHLFYNLGNAYFRLNQLGWAILNYERARLLMPRDADLHFNLGYARDQAQDAVPNRRGFFTMAFFWTTAFNLGELFRGFAVVNLLFWGILLTRFFFRREWMYYLFLVFFIFWLILGASFGIKWYQTATDDRSVILAEEVNILAGPDIKDTVLFKLHAGTIVHLERSEDGWSLVRLPDLKRGWVESENMERIVIRHANFEGAVPSHERILDIPKIELH